MRTREGIPNNQRSRVGEHLCCQDTIAEGFRHLVALNRHKGVMKPMVGVSMTGSARLGKFVFVVGEPKIHTATMNIKTASQISGGHGRALKVPTRAPSAPGGRPRSRVWFACLMPFPERKVLRVAFSTRFH